MICITGDTHGDQERLLKLMREYAWTSDDYLLVAGDFGYLFRNDTDERAFLDRMEAEFPSTIVFIDGNHENFDLLSDYPIEIWKGGKIHRIRHNVIHMMRGQIFELEGKTFFGMGGAYSIDRYRRRLGVSYWDEELPTSAEYQEAVKNLQKHNNQVDYVITHTAPQKVIRWMGERPHAGDSELTGFLEYLMYEVEYKYWYFGHWHRDETLDERFTALWFDVKEID